MTTAMIYVYPHQHVSRSIPPLNLEEHKEEKAVQFAAEVTNRFVALEVAQDEVIPQQKFSGKVPRQSYWKWLEKRLDPSSRKRKRNDAWGRSLPENGDLLQ